MIHEIKHDSEAPTFCISEDDVWRPGSFADRVSAQHAERLTDEQITKLMLEADGNPLSIEFETNYYRVYAGDELLAKEVMLERLGL